MMKLYHFFLKLYKRICWSKERQARSAGVILGRNNFIDSIFWSSEPYLITIGSYCQITAGVKLLTHGGGQILRNKYPDFDSFGKIVIGDYVYLGTNVLVMPGVTIGNNVLCAAGSVITKSIPPNSVVGGNPARYICSLEDYENRNLQYNTHSKGLTYDDKKCLLLNLEEKSFIKKRYLNRG